MRLFSYVVRFDTGFAPNPFFGYCTLACCKPKIRLSAEKGDWVVGLTPRADGNRIVYMMRVDEVLGSFSDYWTDRRFAAKKPNYNKGLREKCGDNIYEPLSTGRYRQLRSAHSNGEAEDEANKAHDLSGRRVLVSETFAYFGSNALPLPPNFRFLAVMRGHRSRFGEEEKRQFMQFTQTVRFGIHGAPRRWPSKDDSWKEGRGCKTKAR